MSSFVDRALLQLHDPVALSTLLTDGGPAPYPRLTRLLNTVFETDSATVDHVQGVTVLTTEPLVWIPTRTHLRGTFTTSQPEHRLSDLCVDVARFDGPWAHLMAQLSLHVVIAVDPGGIESAIISSIENITSLDDFASRFRYLDLPAFLQTHKITTVEQLRAAAQYLLAEIRLKSAPPFDSTNEANAYDVSVQLALTIAEQLDIAAGLTTARQLVSAGALQPPGPASDVLGTARTAFAVAVVFPDGQGDQQATHTAVDSLCAKADILPLFANPP